MIHRACMASVALWLHKCWTLRVAWSILLSLAVHHTPNHLCCGLLEDTGSGTSSGEGRCTSSPNHCIVDATSCWTEWRDHDSTHRCGSKHQGFQEGGRFTGSPPGRRSERVEESVRGWNERRENDGLHHRLLHALLDADVLKHPLQEIDGKYTTLSLPSAGSTGGGGVIGVYSPTLFAAPTKRRTLFMAFERQL